MPALHLRGVLLPDEEERDVWVVDGRLTFGRPPGDAETVSSSGWVLPGLVDAHCHIGLGPGAAHLTDLEDQVAQAVKERDAGVLALRDAGSPVDTSAVQELPELPILIRAGRHIARPRRYLRDLGVEVEPEQLVAAVEEQAAVADGWVKLVGDWIDRGTGDLAPLWPKEVLVQAVARAHELGTRVAVHVFGEDGLDDLVEAGVDSLEHATGLDGSLVDTVARRGIAVVPTLVNIDTFPDIADRGAGKFNRYAAHMRSLHRTSRERVRQAWEAGVPVYTGTDAGTVQPHGRLPEEIAELVAAGIPLAEVIAQASWRGRAWLGLPGIEEGARADLLVLAADPRRDLGTLLDHQALVVGGRRVTRQG